MYQNKGAIDGTWKCSIPTCGFTLDQQVFSSLKSNINEQKLSAWKKLHEAIFEKDESLGFIAKIPKNSDEGKTQKKAENIKWTHEAALEQAEINKHLNAEEVLYKKYGVKIKFTNDLFLKKGWFHQCQTDVRCVKCKEGHYELIRLLIIHYGKSFLRGVVCIKCSDALVRHEIPQDIIKELKEYTISKITKISGAKKSNKKEAKSPKNTTAEIGEIDKSKTNKEEIKERVKSALDKLKTTDDIFYLDYYYPKRNEAHHSSEFSINILKLKNGTAIFPYFMNKLNEISLPKGVAICCVPGSDSNKAASFLRILCLEFCAVNGFEDLSSCLKRNKTIGHSSFQGWHRSKSKTLKTVSLVFKKNCQARWLFYLMM